MWSYESPDPAWINESYANIVLYDHNTKKVKQITKKNRYFDPFIDPQQEKIVAVEYDNGFYSLVLLDINTGKKLENIALGPCQIFSPSWSSDGTHLFYLKTSLNDYRGMGLFMYNIKTGRETTLMDYNTSYGLSHPIHYPQKNAVVFSSDYSGIDNIYLINIASKKVQQLTSRPYGAYHPSISQNKKKGELLLFSDYGGIQGFDTVSIPLIEKNWEALSQVSIRRIDLTAEMDEASEREKIKKITYSPPSKDTKIANGFISTNYYQSKEYNPLKNSINIHSWGLLVELDRLGSLNLHLESDDLLETFSTEIVLGYQISDPYTVTGDTNSLSFPERLVGDFNLSFKKQKIKFDLLNNFQTFKFYPFIDSLESYTFQRLRNVFFFSLPLFFSSPSTRHFFEAALYGSTSFQFGAEELDEIIRNSVEPSIPANLFPARNFNF